MEAKDLDFKTIEGNAPVFHCNTCGEKFFENGFAAGIPFGNDEITIVVCSEYCGKLFKSHPKADEYIQDIKAKVLGV